MRLHRRKCRRCGKWYAPQPHNAYHQRFCTTPILPTGQPPGQPGAVAAA